MLSYEWRVINMKKILIIFGLILAANSVFADETVQIAQNVQTVQPVQTTAAVNPLTVAQNIMFENCTKIFGVNQEKLFYLTLASISANRFNIDEIQSANGYIIFSANRNKYLASVSKVDKANAILKITPCNNVYNFPPGVLTNTFKYIDLNLTPKI